VRFLLAMTTLEKCERRGKQGRKRNHSKQTGEVVELAFMLKAASLGFAVAKPYGDNQRYDFVVDVGGKLVRVQVKSATHPHAQGAYFISSQRCSHGRAIPYEASEIDFLAAHIFPEDAWFIIPVKAFVPRTSLHLFPKERGEAGQFWKYREAWELLRTE
jgi:hypothetical protein